MYSIEDLNSINEKLIPLKDIADRELHSIFGLSGEVYTPHIDYYNEISIEKAHILIALKANGIVPLSEVDIISEQLNILHKKVQHHGVVEHEGICYERRFSPLKLSKTGKIVRKWARYWLRHLPSGEVDNHWEKEVREIWPEYFLLSFIDI